MNDIRITPLAPYTSEAQVDSVSAGEVVQTGFGGRTLDDCIADAEEHLRTAGLVQYVFSEEQLVGFAMYEEYPGSLLYLNGIVLRHEAQSRAIGTTMLHEAIEATNAKRLFAVTRNPAILRMFETVCNLVQPTAKCPHGSIVSEAEVARLATKIGLPQDNLPYHRDRYPRDLYDRIPTHRNPVVQEQFEITYDLRNITDAVMLIGEIHE